MHSRLSPAAGCKNSSENCRIYYEKKKKIIVKKKKPIKLNTCVPL